MFFSAFLNGLTLGAALIIAVGAQNIFVLQQGVARNRVFVICLLSSLIDAGLIILGAVGLGALIATMEWLTVAAAWGGALFVAVFGFLSLRRAFGAGKDLFETGTDQQPVVSSLKKAILLTLAFGLLNPHVYIDTVMLLGSIAAQYETEQRLYFVAGAVLASFAWFFAIGYGARAIGPILRKPKAQKALDILIAIIMFTVAAQLIYGII